MNQIKKKAFASLGYDFVAPEYIPKGQDEYYLRRLQNRNGVSYRALSPKEIKALIGNGNTSDNWEHVVVADGFTPSLVHNCKFYGLVRIGKLEPYFLEFSNLRLPVGLYNSMIVSCDIGDNCVIDHVNFMSHYIVGNDVMLVNVNELVTTDHSKFGNGIIRKGEKESVRIWIELCNENAGRSILPFNGIQPGDAFLWSKHRDDEKLLDRFRAFTEKQFDKKRGYYGKIGDRTVIKNSRIIKDVWIGTDAYIKGANKLKNLTINSSAEAKSQVGEGCELVNGIVGFGCKAFYGVKAVRFIMGSNSQLKYGARLINSYLADNSTISCCEVLNSLIFPGHEQHHNNSFLCAALVMGQSNMAAGATIGSNHNSRGADGEIVAGRGFWPGLCVSLKHNSMFASFTLLAKGDFPAELNIPIPFSLVSNDASKDRLVIMPGYWFSYNMYALARNAGKYVSRDKRLDKTQRIEYDFLAPDSVNEMFDALAILKKSFALAQFPTKKATEAQLLKTGGSLLEKASLTDTTEVFAVGLENSQRKIQLVKVPQAYRLFKELIVYYGVTQLAELLTQDGGRSLAEVLKIMGSPKRTAWKNIGGQLIPAASVKKLIDDIHHNEIASWDAVHNFYNACSANYDRQKQQHAFACLLEVLNLSRDQFTARLFDRLLQQAVETKKWMTQQIFESRAKDYQNEFRQMVYANKKEMEMVIGKLEDNQFIAEQRTALKVFEEEVKGIREALKTLSKKSISSKKTTVK